MVRWCADAVAGLLCRSCLIDGEAVACDDQGTPVFNLLIRKYASAQLYAFDLLELDGEDLRGEPIEKRKASLNQLLGADRAGLLISQPIDAPADVAFRHICQLGLEGIVSNRGASVEMAGARGMASIGSCEGAIVMSPKCERCDGTFSPDSL